MTIRNVVFPAGRQTPYKRSRYSLAAHSDGLLFVPNQVGSRDDGSPEPELKIQVRRAFDNLGAVLVTVGCGLDDMLDVTVFMVDAEINFERI